MPSRLKNRVQDVQVWSKIRQNINNVYMYIYRNKKSKPSIKE